jgi:DNA excision repair protein ERCC-5
VSSSGPQAAAHLPQPPPAQLSSGCEGQLDSTAEAASAAADAEQQQPTAAADGAETPAQREFKRTHKGVRRTWQLPAHFPSARVMEAYSQPQVDRNSARFNFGKPDSSLLQQFCR